MDELREIGIEFLWAVIPVAVVALIIGFIDLMRRKYNSRKTLVEVRAKVVGKRMETYRSRHNTNNYYYVTFKPENGGPAVEFRVSDLYYHRMDYGQADTLRYRGWEMLSFGEGLEDVKPIAPLPAEHDELPPEESGWSALMRKLGDKVWDWADYPLIAWDWLCTAYDRIRAWIEARRTRPVEDESPAQKKPDGILTHELDD